jgi:ArsR family metal-binding transcriptional regulator
MSQEGGSLFQKFESFLKRLQNWINKGLDCKLVASKIKEVEVKREEEVKTILPTSETKEELKILILAFAIKLKQAENDEVV